MQVPLGSTNRSIPLQVVDDTGLGVTGLVAATFPSLFYALEGPFANVAIGTLNDLAALTDAYNALGVKERGGGYYRFDSPNGMYAAAGDVRIWGDDTGKHVLFPPIEVQAGYGTGTGANTVTITVNDGTNPIAGARVRLTIGSLTYLSITNTSGVVSFNVDNGTWAIAITAAGYTFTGTTLVVSGDTTHTYSMTQTSIVVVSPGLTTGYLTCYDINGNVASGVNIIATMIKAGSSDTGHAYTSATNTQTSDVNGLVQFELVIGATYRFTRGANGPPYVVNVPANAGDTYALNPLIGTP